LTAIGQHGVPGRNVLCHVVEESDIEIEHVLTQHLSLVANFV